MSLCGVPKQSHHTASGGCWVFRDTAAFTSGAEAQSRKGEREERRWKRLRERPGDKAASADPAPLRQAVQAGTVVLEHAGPAVSGGVSSVSPSQTSTWCAFRATRSVSRGHSSVSSGTR